MDEITQNTTQNVSVKIKEIEEKLDKVYSMADRNRKYFLTTMLVFIFLVLSLTILMFLLPSLWTYSNVIYVNTTEETAQ